MYQIVLADRSRVQAARWTFRAARDGLQRSGTNSTTLRRLQMAAVLA